MTLTELVTKAPALLAELAAAGAAASVTLGACGTAIEHVGSVLGLRGVERVGQTIEALFADIPKLLRGSRATADLNARIDAAIKQMPDYVKGPDAP